MRRSDWIITKPDNFVPSHDDRESRQVRSFHVEGARAADLLPIIKANVAKEAAVMTDEAGQYHKLGDDFASHAGVNHCKEEYVRGDLERTERALHGILGKRLTYLDSSAAAIWDGGSPLEQCPTLKNSG